MTNHVENSYTDEGTGQTLYFNEEGMFVDSEGNGPQKGFKNDNTFGDWLHSYIQQKLIEAGLIIHIIKDNVPIFHTPNALNSAKKLLVLICGSGRIMAGLWSVGVCAYRGLKAGSVLPCIEEARKRNMEVIIFNPNHPNASSNFKHSEDVFNELVIPSNPKRVWIIAHSMGGDSTCDIISHNPEWCIQHVSAFALTDGCEGLIHSIGFKINKWSHIKGINWIQSDEKLNEPLEDGFSTKHRSAETNDHPLTTFKAFPFIWIFFDENGANADESPPLQENFVGTEKLKYIDFE